MKNIKNGFTIIELIVTIAIIATLSTIVIVNVSNYINKSKDTKIIANLNQIAKNGQMLFSENGNYTDLSDLDLPHEIYTLRKNETAFIAYAPLSSGNYWCVDYTGASKELSTAPDEESYNCIAGGGDDSGSGDICNNDLTCNESEGENCSNCYDCDCASRYGYGYTCYNGNCIYGQVCNDSGQYNCLAEQYCCQGTCCDSNQSGCCYGTCYNPGMYKCCGQGLICSSDSECCGNTCCGTGSYCSDPSTGICSYY